MPRNGSGTFSRSNGVNSGSTVWQQDAAEPVNILDTRHDSHDQDIADAISASIAKDGQTTPTADLPMGGFKHTNVADATARTNYAKVSQIQDASYTWGGTSSGSESAQTITLSPAPTSYVTGEVISFITGFENTGTVSLNKNSLGAKTINKYIGGVKYALLQGDLPLGYNALVRYDGTNYILLNPQFPNLIDRVGSTTTVTNSGANTQIYSKTLGGGELAAYRGLRLRAFGTLVNTTGGTNANIVFTVVSGATTLLTMHSHQVTAGIGTVAWGLIVEWQQTNNTAAQRITGILTADRGSSTSFSYVKGTTGSINAASSFPITIKGQLDAADALISFTLNNATLELI